MTLPIGTIALASALATLMGALRVKGVLTTEELVQIQMQCEAICATMGDPAGTATLSAVFNLANRMDGEPEDDAAR